MNKHVEITKYNKRNHITSIQRWDADAREQMPTEQKQLRPAGHCKRWVRRRKKKKKRTRAPAQYLPCPTVDLLSRRHALQADVRGGRGSSASRPSHGSRRANHTRPYSPCRLKILVIVSCTYCCNLAPLKLKLPWRESKQTASVSHQEASGLLSAANADQMTGTVEGRGNSRVSAATSWGEEGNCKSGSDWDTRG